MSPSPNEVRHDVRFAVVGNPGGRRVEMFADAVLAAGLPAPRVLPWREVLYDGRPRFEPGETVRLDSPGEDEDVELLLRGADDPTRVEGTAHWYARFTGAARQVTEAARAADAAALDDPDELAVMFDKRLCHGVLSEAGVPVPPSPTSGPQAPPVRGWEDVRALLAGSGGLRRAFVKLAHGSSASGVLAVEWGAHGRVRAATSVERTADGQLFNSLRVRRYETEAEIAAIVDTLAPDGLHIERWVPKAAQHGRAADLRVVVVDGRASHAVVRTSRSPMTNLHLGGIRGGLLPRHPVRRRRSAAGHRMAALLGRRGQRVRRSAAPADRSARQRRGGSGHLRRAGRDRAPAAQAPGERGGRRAGTSGGTSGSKGGRRSGGRGRRRCPWLSRI